MKISIGVDNFAHLLFVFISTTAYCIVEYGQALVIISGGCGKGADWLAKTLALSKNVTYKEYPPIHEPHNAYCVLEKSNYNKPYHVKNYFERNTLVAEACDKLIAFVSDGVQSNGTQDTIKKARKFGKSVLICN